MRCFWITLAVCLCVSSLVGTPTANAADRTSSQPSSKGTAQSSISRVEQALSFGTLPLSFEANQGQSDGQVRFLSRGSGYSFFLTRDGALLTFARDSRSDAAVFQMQLSGANPRAQIRGLDELPGKSNYFFGNDARRWRTAVPTYSKVAYENIYPGINLVYYGTQRQLEYDFVLSPGADPKQIQLAVSGADKISVDASGNLVLHSTSGDVQLLAPNVYQQIQGRKHQVAGQWVLTANNTAGFNISNYDRAEPLVIDPVLQYSSFLGGSQKNALSRIAVDAAGNAYVAGYTASGDFPAAPTPQATTFGNGTPSRGAFVAKIDATGSTLLYTTYLSGSVDEEATGLAVDTTGNVYIAGTTRSPDFPVHNALQANCATHTQAATCSSAFLTKISPSGDLLLFSTYLGGSGGESARGLAIDATGNAYLVGTTSSVDFPVTSGAAQAKCAGPCQQNAFVAKFSSAGDKLEYATYLGGSGMDDSADIAVDASGSAYVTGHTTSPDFPTAGSYQKSCAQDPSSSSGPCVATAFVTKLKADGSAFVYSTYLGGTLGSQANGIAVDSQGSAYVTGSTLSSDFPVVKAYQKSCAKDTVSGFCSLDAFVTRFAPSGKTVVYSTYLGGSGEDEALGIALDTAGNAHIVGRTESADFPLVAAGQKQLNGTSDAFVARLNAAGSSLSFSTYHGGSAAESGNGIALDAKGSVYVTGITSSVDFPTLHPFQSSCAGSCANAFVSKLALPPASGPAWTISKTHTDPFLQGQTGATYTITATNSGTTATDGTTVTVVDTIPSGLTATALTGTGWTCVLGTATCTRTDVLAAGASYPQITLTVTVANNAAASLTNSVQVSGGGATNPGSTTDPTNVIYPIAIHKSDSGNFVQGRSGVTYTVSGMTNNGNTATSGVVSVADTLPSGFSATAMTGTGWTCNVGTVSCTRSDALAGGSTYPNITITVTVPNNAPASVTNQVNISGGGFTLSATASDTTPVLPAPVLSVKKAHTGTFMEGNTGTWTITVSNTAPSSITYGTLTVTDDLPSGSGYTYTLASGTGTNWSCSTSGTTTITVTCTDSVDTVTGGSDFPVLTLSVNIPGGSPASVSNTATASGAGALTSASGSDNNVPVTFPLTAAKTDSGNFIQGRTGVTYTISGKNNGNSATSATVIVADALPTGITATAMSGTGFGCTVATTTCTSTAPIASGASYSITLTVNVANNATSPLVNNVTVSETGFALNATAQDTTTILPAPVLSVNKGHSGAFMEGNLGTWTIAVSNTLSGSVTYGTLTVTDTLPAGFTLSAATGTNWSCSGTTTITCTDSTDVVNGGSSFPTLSLTANIPGAASGTITNTATASGAGALASANGSDNVNVSFPLTAAKIDSGNFIQGRTGVTYTISGKNTGNSATSATVTVADALPTGITATAMSGTGFSCTVATTTCTSTAPIASGASYSITLTVNIANTASSPLVNNVTVTETGFALNATAQDTTTVLLAPVLSVSKGHSGTFTQGGTASWTISVSNTQSGSVTYGSVTVTDILPSGTLPTGVTYTYTLSSGTGTNWSCSPSGTSPVTVTCTDSVDVVPGGSSFPVLTLTVNIPTTSAISISNTATATGAGALASAMGSDNVTVVQAPKTINVISGTPQSAPVTNQYAAQLVAQVLDAGGVGVNNVSVDFNSPASGAGATPNPAAATTQGTGANAGTATVTVSANGNNGTYPITATVAGVTSPAFTLTNADFTLSSVAPTSTIYIQGQNTPFAPAGTSVTTVTALPTPSASQPSYTGTVTLGCSAASLPSGVACTSFTPASASFANGGPAANVPSSLALSVSTSTPVGLYTAAIAPTVVGVDGSNPKLMRSAGFSLAVQCVLSLQQTTPSLTPAAGTAANQFTIGVSVAQGGSACPYGSLAVVGGSTPGAVVGDGNVVTTIVTGASGTATAAQSKPVTFEIGAPGAAAQQGHVNVPFFDATKSSSQSTATMPAEVEAVSQPLALANGIAGQKTGNATLTQTLPGTLTITKVGTGGSFCGVVDSNGNPDPTGNNFGVTCLWNVSTPSQVTVNLQLTGSAMNHESRARLGMVFALFLPGMVFVGAGFSVFGPRRWRTAQQKLTVLLGILLLMSLVVVLPACGGGFNATFLKNGNGNFTVTLLGYTSSSGVTVSGIEIFTIPISTQ